MDKIDILRRLAIFRTLLVASVIAVIAYFVIMVIKIGLVPLVFVGGFLLSVFLGLTTVNTSKYFDGPGESWAAHTFNGKLWLLFRGTWFRTMKTIRVEDLNQLPKNCYVKLDECTVFLKDPKLAVQLKLTME